MLCSVPFLLGFYIIYYNVYNVLQILLLRQAGAVPAAIGKEHLARDAADLVRRQEAHAAGDLLRLQQTLHGDHQHDVVDVDDALIDALLDHMKLGLDESVITMAGLAVAKRSYHILQEMKSDAIIMPAGLRGAYHLTEMAGGRLLYTINTRVQDMILEADPPQVEKIAEPIPAETLSQLQRIPEFVRAYEPDGMKPSEFITYGVTQKLLSQFMETGWSPLETYMSSKKTSRWI